MRTSKFRSKITQQQNNEMRRLYEEGFGIQYIARRFNCWPNTVWTHVFDLSTPRKITQKERKYFTKNSNLSDSDVLKIRQLAKEGRGSPTIAMMYNMSQSAALGIISGKTYRWVKSTTSKGDLIPIKYRKIRRKTDLQPGSKPGSKKTTRGGVLIKLSKEFNVAPCTIRRWIVNEKLKLKKNEKLKL